MSTRWTAVITTTANGDFPFDEDGRECEMVVSRLGELRFVDTHTNIVLSTVNVPYGSSLYFQNGDTVKKGDKIAQWDPFNAVIVTRPSNKIIKIRSFVRRGLLLRDKNEREYARPSNKIIKIGGFVRRGLLLRDKNERESGAAGEITAADRVRRCGRPLRTC